MLTDNSNEDTMPLDKGNSEVDLSPELKELEKKVKHVNADQHKEKHC